MHVPKEKLKVTVLVDRFRIVGDMYKYPGARLLDLVNVKDNPFIPITDADIYSLSDGKKLYSASFIGINRTAVSFFYPMEEEEQTKQAASLEPQ
jgi:hypothetical protein